jgi:hypothetical protein
MSCSGDCPFFIDKFAGLGHPIFLIDYYTYIFLFNPSNVALIRKPSSTYQTSNSEILRKSGKMLGWGTDFGYLKRNSSNIRLAGEPIFA